MASRWMVALAVGLSAAPSAAKGPGCPASFDRFWALFKIDAAFQRQHTAATIRDSRLVDARDHDLKMVGGDVARAELVFPLVEVRGGDITRIVGGAGPRPVVNVSVPDSDAYVVTLYFEKRGCWTLIRREDNSL